MNHGDVVEIDRRTLRKLLDEIDRTRMLVASALEPKAPARTEAGPGLIDITTASERSGLSKETIRRACAAGAGVMHAGRWFITTTNLQQLRRRRR